MSKLLPPLIVALALAGASLYAQTCHGPGTERWPIKTSVPEGTDLNKAGQTAPLAKLLALADPQGLHHNDGQFQSARIPAFTNSLNAKEGDILSTTGWLYLVATELDDCDYHIQISTSPRTTTDKPTPDDDCLVIEAPRPDFIEDKDLSSLSGQIRDGIKRTLLANKEPSTSGSVMQHPVCVQAQGQLFYDDAHLTANGEKELRGKRGMSSHTLWELHPITGFKIVPVAACQ
jgi:hypothetical protein